MGVGGVGGGEGCALRLVETFFQLQTGFQLLIQNKLFPSFSCHFFKNALQKPLFTIKYDKFILKIIEKTYKSVVASVSYISLNLNFHIPYKMLIDFFKFFLRHLFKQILYGKRVKPIYLQSSYKDRKTIVFRYNNISGCRSYLLRQDDIIVGFFRFCHNILYWFYVNGEGVSKGN